MDMHNEIKNTLPIPYHPLCDGALCIDDQHRIIDADAQFCAWIGMQRAELVGRHWPSLFHPLDRAELEMAIAALAQQSQAHTLLQGFLNQQGSDQIYLQLFRAPDSQDGHYFCLIMNLALRVNYTSSKRRYEKLFELSHDLLCIANTMGYFVQVNPTFTRLLGYPAEDLLNKSFLEYVHPDDVDATVNEIRNLRSGVDTLYFENRYRRKDGSWCWLAWSTPAPSSDGLLYAVAKDITERKEFEQQLTRMAKYDVVSGLPNRNYLEDEVVRAAARCQRNFHFLNGLLLQLPQLSALQQRLGTDAADDLVLQYSLRLRRLLRTNDFIAHTSSNTFCVLIEADTAIAMQRVIEKLSPALHLAFYWNDQHVPVQGVLSSPQVFHGDPVTPQEWLQNLLAQHLPSSVPVSTPG